ncbi:MAG: hypothetical protein V1794_17360 [Candidatus Glassbacteria bacterium]
MAHSAWPTFEGGPNITIKVPSYQYQDTIAFYRDVLGLAAVRDREQATAFRFGRSILRIDKASHLSQAEVWLELATEDVARAAAHCKRCGVVRTDGIEELPEGFDGFWIASPAGIIHLVAGSRR